MSAEAASATRDLLPLAGKSFRPRAGGAAARICAEHLTRLGATPDGDDAAVHLLDAGAQQPSRGLAVIFESHHLDGGGLVASEITAQATIGLTDYIAGPGETPARIGCDIGSAVTGFCAVQAVLAWLLGGGTPDRAEAVRVSPLRTLATLKTILIAARIRPDAWTGTHVRSRDRKVDSGYRTSDGRVTLDFPYNGRAAWTVFARAIGLTDATVERIGDRWYETVGWGDDVDEYRPVYDRALARLSTEEALALIRGHGGSSVPFLALEECLDHPQARALGLAESLATGLPWRLDVGAGRAVAAPPRTGARSGMPLAGYRVLDLGVGGVGPYAGALLAWLGADVLKIEAPNEFIHVVRPLAGGVSTTYLALNQGKRSTRLDLKDRGQRQRLLDLVAGADVVMENFRPGALDRAGFGFADLAAVRPGIVYASASGFGWDGPLAAEPCTDPHTQAFSGFAWANRDAATGLPRRIRYYGFVDLVTSCVFAEAILAGLAQGRAVGSAVHVRTSMLHAVTAALGAAGADPAPVLDGIFETLDGHIAITCRDSAELERLHQITGGSDVASLLARLPSTAWTHALAAAGIPCARLMHDDEVNARKDLWAAGVVRELPLPHAPPLAAGGPPWAFGDSVPAGPPAPYPGTDEARWLA